MIKNTDIAYASGYFDGDGCLYIGKQKKKFPAKTIVTSTNKNVLDWFKETFGGNIILTKISSKHPTHKPCHRFHKGKIGSIQFVKKLLPFLVERTDEARIFLAFAKSQKHGDRIDFIDQMKAAKNTNNLVYREQKELFESNRSSITPTLEDFAFLAGFIDAECCFSISKYKSAYGRYCYKIHLSCNNSKAPIFKWLLERFGGRINFINRSKRSKKERDQFAWRLSCRALFNIINSVYPFLKHKKPVCAKLIEFYDTTLPNGGDRQSAQFREQYAAAIVKRECIVKKVHELNSKGI